MILDPSTNTASFGWNIEGALPPPGQYVGVCLDIKDQLGVERKAFQSDVMEKRDVTRFLFGIRDPRTHQLYLVQTFEMSISGAANSNLVQFLRGWTNRDPYGFDYLELKGQGALLTISHKQSTRTPGLVYAQIVTVSPVYPTLQGEIPQLGLFTELIAKANIPRVLPTNPAAVAGAPATIGVPAPGIPERKFWTQGTNGAIILVTEKQLIQKGEPHRMIMAENQVGGWMPASSVINFPIASPTPPAPPPAPAFPPAPPAAPPPMPPPPPMPGTGFAGLPTQPEEVLPF